MLTLIVAFAAYILLCSFNPRDKTTLAQCGLIGKEEENDGVVDQVDDKSVFTGLKQAVLRSTSSYVNHVLLHTLSFDLDLAVYRYAAKKHLVIMQTPMPR